VNQGIELARKIDFRYGLARLLLNKSYSLANLKEMNERNTVLEELLRLAETTPGLEPMRQNALINLAALSNELRRYKQGAEYAARAEAASDRKADPNGYAFALMNRGSAWVNLGRVDEGLALIDSAIHVAEQVGDQRELADLIEQQVNALEAAGRLQPALHALRRWVSLSNEVTSAQREQIVAGLQEKMASKQRLQEIERLRLDNAARDAQLQLRAWRERAWAGGAAAVLLLAFGIWQKLARTRAVNSSLRTDVARLSSESQHDVLTGGYNRRYGEALLQQLRDDASLGPADPRTKVSLVLLDVDHFKRVNDTYGHAAGDAVLIEMTARLKAVLRDGDAVVRWGGEEFLLILPDADASVLQAIAKRALDAIGSLPFDLPQGAQLPVRASAGGVVWPSGGGTPWTGQLALADAALYRAKAQGRNRAVFAIADADVPDADLGELDDLLADGRVRLRSVEGMVPPTTAAPAPGAGAASSHSSA
jgi:diguanylate cyclase (GGDEF)-like protein